MTTSAPAAPLMAAVTRTRWSRTPAMRASSSSTARSDSIAATCANALTEKGMQTLLSDSISSAAPKQ